MQIEASGAAAGDGFRSARAQHTYVIPPQDVREASDGAFWSVQGGAMAPVRVLPVATTHPEPVPAAPVVVDEARSERAPQADGDLVP